MKSFREIRESLVNMRFLKWIKRWLFKRIGVTPIDVSQFISIKDEVYLLYEPLLEEMQIICWEDHGFSKTSLYSCVNENDFFKAMRKIARSGTQVCCLYDREHKTLQKKQDSFQKDVYESLRKVANEV